MEEDPDEEFGEGDALLTPKNVRSEGGWVEEEGRGGTGRGRGNILYI